MAPVGVPQLAAGQNAKAGLARTGAALGEANGRLVESRAWYADLQKTYGNAP